MKPAWDKLGDEYAASSSVLIADADCTASADELCEQFEIRGCTYLSFLCDVVNEEFVALWYVAVVVFLFSAISNERLPLLYLL